MTGRDETPRVVTFHLWGVRPAAVPRAVARMARDRRPLRRCPGLHFAKLLGTGAGRTFGPRDADPRHWAVLASWSSVEAAEAFDAGRLVRGWDGLAEERLRVTMRPLASRGTWSGARPFGDPRPSPYVGAVAAVTRARIAPAHWLRFWRAVPPVAADLHRGGGVRMALGIGEAPVGFQGTFSLWSSEKALRDFAHRRGPHVDVVRRTAEVGWYAEELFARFAVLSLDGTFAGRAP